MFTLMLIIAFTFVVLIWFICWLKLSLLCYIFSEPRWLKNDMRKRTLLLRHLSLFGILHVIPWGPIEKGIVKRTCCVQSLDTIHFLSEHLETHMKYMARDWQIFRFRKTLTVFLGKNHIYNVYNNIYKILNFILVMPLVLYRIKVNPKLLYYLHPLSSIQEKTEITLEILNP